MPIPRQYQRMLTSRGFAGLGSAVLAPWAYKPIPRIENGQIVYNEYPPMPKPEPGTFMAQVMPQPVERRVPITVQNAQRAVNSNPNAGVSLYTRIPYKGTLGIEVSPDGKLRWYNRADVSVSGAPPPPTFKPYAPGETEPNPQIGWMSEQDWTTQRDTRQSFTVPPPSGPTPMTLAQQSFFDQMLAPFAPSAPPAVFPVGVGPPVGVVSQPIVMQAPGTSPVVYVGLGLLGLLAVYAVRRATQERT